MRKLKSSLAMIALSAMMAATITPLCGILFRCGCTLLEGLEHCNIWNGVSPGCPWCSHGWTGFLVPFTTIVVLTLTTTSLVVSRQHSVAVIFLVGVVAYGFWAFFTGLATAAYWDYPWFLWWSSV